MEVSAYKRRLSYDLLVTTAAILLAISSLQITGCAAKSEREVVADVSRKDIIEERWGVQILGIRCTAAGFMLDFRYRVTDAEKASPLFDRATKPYLIDQDTGAKFLVPNPPKTGPLRTSNKPQQDRVYWMFFGNLGRYVKPGSKVTVVIGDFKAENLTVE